MSSQKKHINIFDELIRVLNLKKHTLKHKDVVDDIMPSFDIKYTPGNERSQEIINELIVYQSKINRRKAIHKLYYSLLISGVLLLSILLCVRSLKRNEEKNQNIPFNQEQNLYQKNDSALSAPDTIKDTNNQRDKDRTNISYRIKQIEIDTIKILVTDTVHKKACRLDTLVKKLIITDTIHVNPYEPEINSGNYCLFPQRYRIQFDERSAFVDEKYNNDIVELANNIHNCQNLHNVEIIGYYTQRFLFFNSKKLVQERIENIKKEIMKHYVSSQTIRESKENLIKTTKLDKLDSSQCVEIILKD